MPSAHASRAPWEHAGLMPALSPHVPLPRALPPLHPRLYQLDTPLAPTDLSLPIYRMRAKDQWALKSLQREPTATELRMLYCRSSRLSPRSWDRSLCSRTNLGRQRATRLSHHCHGDGAGPRSDTCYFNASPCPSSPDFPWSRVSKSRQPEGRAVEASTARRA